MTNINENSFISQYRTGYELFVLSIRLLCVCRGNTLHCFIFTNCFYWSIRFEDELENEMLKCILPASGATLEMPAYAVRVWNSAKSMP